MSNWPRNHADFSHPNWTARCTDRRAELDWPVQHPTEPGWVALTVYATLTLATFVTGFWLLVAVFG